MRQLGCTWLGAKCAASCLLLLNCKHMVWSISLTTALLLPLSRVEPPRTAAAGIGVLWAEFPVQMFYRAVECFLLLPDLQQSEQLCCRHWIAMSIIDYFKSYWDLGNQIAGSLGNLSREVEGLLIWNLVFSEVVCLIDVAIISPGRRCIIKSHFSQEPYEFL